MRKTVNKEHIEGRLYDFDLTEKQVSNTTSKVYGTNFISGSISIATDEDCLNVISVYFSYVPPTTKAGKSNSTYNVLKQIMTSGKTVLAVGAGEATLVAADPSLALNDFYTDRSGEWTLVSSKRNSGGFVSIVRSLNANEAARSTFECDVLINGVRTVEADPDNGIDNDYLIVKGAIFDFSNAIMPMDFVVKDPDGIKYFESLDINSQNMVFTKIWGTINNSTVVTRKEEATAFGAPIIKESTKSVREWIITATSRPEAVYEIGDAQTGITLDEIKTALANREVYLAGERKRAEDYQAQKAKGTVANSAVSAAAGGFNF